MKLNIYNVIKGPRVTEKAQKLNERFKQLVLEIHPKANKPQVVQALEKLFNVRVKTIRIKSRKGKVRVAPRTRIKTRGKLQKTAIVTLKEGYSLNLFQQAQVDESKATTTESQVPKKKTAER